MSEDIAGVDRQGTRHRDVLEGQGLAPLGRQGRKGSLREGLVLQLEALGGREGSKIGRRKAAVTGRTNRHLAAADGLVAGDLQHAVGDQRLALVEDLVLGLIDEEDTLPRITKSGILTMPRGRAIASSQILGEEHQVELALQQAVRLGIVGIKQHGNLRVVVRSHQHIIAGAESGILLHVEVGEELAAVDDDLGVVFDKQGIIKEARRRGISHVLIRRVGIHRSDCRDCSPIHRECGPHPAQRATEVVHKSRGPAAQHLKQTALNHRTTEVVQSVDRKERP